MDYFSEIAGLGLGSRLRRLSDYFMLETGEIYKKLEIDFEPRWFPLFSLLTKVNEISITEASKMLKITHPHIVNISKELESKGLLESRTNKKDSRSRKLKITKKGQKLELELRPTWRNIQRVIEQSYQEIGFDLIKVLQKSEDYFVKDKFSFEVEKLKSKFKNDNIQIDTYKPEYRKYFEVLNRQWIEKYFNLEHLDEELFSDPKNKIIDQGGEIFFAILNGDVVGTCAVCKNEEDFEIAKMAVDENYRGCGVSNHLMEKSIEFIRSKNSKKIILITNSKLLPAINLYKKFGFKIVNDGATSLYKRGDVVMEKSLD